MTVTTDAREPRTDQSATMCSRVLVGIDGSPESIEAARQGARLLVEGGDLTLLSAYDIAPTLVGGVGGGYPTYLDDEAQRGRAVKAVRAAHAEVSDAARAEERVVRGCPWDELVREAEREHDTLVAVGSHGRGRVMGLVLGSTATEIVHKTPCSVLVARAATSTFPNVIVVGVDGSQQSLAAAEIAVELAARFGATVQAIAATGGRPVDVDGVHEVRRRFNTTPPLGSNPALKASSLLRWSDESPVAALVGASSSADLLIVGSRGLHGLSAIGSVSERLAHEARCSVLIVRGSKSDRESENAIVRTDDDAGR